MSKEYFLGLDCGTSSVGWAVTDTEYNLQKAKGKTLWGIRLFEQANPAAERRSFRAARRRTYRKRARLDLIDEMFEEEIKKVDSNFFQRLKDSKYYQEDKTNPNDKNTLFNDKNFNDVIFHRTYPTIYHLRAELIHNTEPHDIRLVYLAIHHIIKNRGHFIYEGQNIEKVQDVQQYFDTLQLLFDDLYKDFSIQYPNGLEVIKVALTDKSDKNRLKTLKESIIVSSEDTKVAKQIQGEIIKALLGKITNIIKLIPDDLLDEETLSNKDFTFSSSTYDDIESAIQGSVGVDNFAIISCLKEIYDWALLYDILKGNQYLSNAKINTYEIHKEQLELLKKIVKKYNPEKYEEAFLTTKDKLYNYSAYIGHGLDNGRKDKGPIKSKCSQEDVNKYFKKLLDKAHKSHPEDEDLNKIYFELENNKLLPKIVSPDNRVIPYQVNLMELEAILDNASKYFNFLNEKDKEGYSSNEKIIAIMKFRIPYYVGPLVENTGEGKEYQKFSWMIRKDNSTGRILPWKFNDQVDLAACGNEFIKRMARKCTYLPNENCLPKNSLLYSEYTLLNELNNLKINGEKPSLELKNQIFELFKSTKTVSNKKIKDMLISRGIYNKKSEIIFTGIDNNFKSSLKSYIDFKGYISNKILSKNEIEQIIEWSTIFTEGQNLLEKKIRDNFKEKLDDKQIKEILSKCKSYTGWGNLSKKFLTEMYHIKEDGECKSIISLMRETSDNLMELMSKKYTISDYVEKELSNYNNNYDNFSYDNLVEPLAVSPSIKRSIWQTLQIVKEISEVQKQAPKRIFIEMARGPEDGQKNRRTISRRNTLLDLYRKYLSDNDEATKIIKSLENHSDDDLRKDKLYLYFTQMGRCMYSNEKIEIEDLFNNNIYDIDHIYPQKSIKDDSLDNRVLVLKRENGKKGDKYPLTDYSPDIHNRCSSLWSFLYKKGLISKEKYNRLNRKTNLDEDELSKFIARQIVETRQSTKATGKILEKLYPNSNIIYSKANSVTQFKRRYGIKKSRGVNDLHHAKDAYLNIVVGNAYYTKFTKDPRFIFKNENRENYHITNIFNYDIKRSNYVAWECDINERKRREEKHQIGNKPDFNTYPETGTILKVKATLSKNNILFTRQTFQRSGGISDMLIVKKNDDTSALLPIKSSDVKMTSMNKYGGLNKIAKAYFFLAEYTNKKKRIKRILDVPIHKVSEIESGKLSLLDYCINELNLENPHIVIPKILINTKIKLNNFIYEISGAMGDSMGLKAAVPLVVSDLNYNYYCRVENYLEKMKEYLRFHKNESDEIIQLYNDKIINRFKINEDNNLSLYKELQRKLNNSVFCYRVNPKTISSINEHANLFKESDIFEQSQFLEQFILLFACKYGTVDFSLIKSPKKTEMPTMGRKLNTSIEFIYQSVTGIYESRKKVEVN